MPSMCKYSEGDVISLPSSDYQVQTRLGCGTFGEVRECRKVATNETVALKILKPKKNIGQAKEEAATLNRIQDLGSDKFNIIRLNNSFLYEGSYCLEFEKLDIDLSEFLEMNQRLELQRIRPIVQQVATALQFLKNARVVHADLKPDNIMMVDHVHQPLKVKVIDFGLALSDPEENTGGDFQTLWYKSPEILLGTPFSEAIDVWSLGCIAAELFTGSVLFPGSDDYDMLRHIYSTTGIPDHMLNTGHYTELFFSQRNTRRWRLKTPHQAGNFECVRRTITDLSDLMKEAPFTLSGEDGRADLCDRESFVDLLIKMLRVDPADRITPSQILQHPFITMSHLVGAFNTSPHVKSCVRLMRSCQAHSSGAGGEKTSDSPALRPDQGHPAGLSCEEHPVLQSAKISERNSSSKQRKQRKRDADGSECGNRISDAHSDKRKRKESLNATETGRKTRTLLNNRKRDEADQCTTSNGKKRRADLHKELDDSVTKLLSNSTEARSSTMWDKRLRRRKRADEEALGSADKRRKRSLCGEGW